MENALRSALRYLAAVQQSDGGFVSLSSATAKPFRAQYRYHTTFASSVILAALSQLDDPVALEIRNKLAAFLLTQKSPQWSFNYWVRESDEAKKLSYPDDLDDTFCALSALWLHDPLLVDGAALAKMTKLLVATESQVGGPYRTWLMPAKSPEVWRDIDLAVNANIAYFLSLVAQPLPHLTVFMEQAIEKRRFISPYYPSFYPVVYFITRAYRGPHQERLAAFLRTKRHKDGSWGTLLPTALATTSLLRHGDTKVTEAIDLLLSNQQADGAWPAEAFCFDPAINGQKFYSGSSALTTALAVEALNAFGRATDLKKRPPSIESLPTTPIIAAASRELSSLDRNLSHAALKILHRIEQSDHAEEIIMLPRLFYDSLRAKPTLSSHVFTDLSLANLYGWMAYTIYDDFLDNEGDPQLLSVANVSMRRSLTAFSRSVPARFSQFVQRTFDIMDEANTWEVTHCRFGVDANTITIKRLPNYGRLTRLADRSLGHALTPLAIAALAGLPPESSPAYSVQTALRHYLIARQLNDDAHDWQADLTAGRITFVVAHILKGLDIPSGTHPLPALLPQLEQYFWHHTLPYICDTITHHAVKGRKAVAHSELLRADSIITKMFDGIDASVTQTRTTLTTATQFLQAYRKGPL